jgi:hypothetical protein
VQNVSKFFTRVRDAARVLKYDNVREFVNHLDALIDAGDDPPLAEADSHARRPRAHRAQGQGARVADRVHGGLRAEQVPVDPPVRSPRDAARAHQGSPAHRRLPRAGGAPPLLRGHDPRQGAPLPHQRGGHGRQAQVEGEPVRAGSARPAEGRGAPLSGAGHRGAAAPGARPGAPPRARPIPTTSPSR